MSRQFIATTKCSAYKHPEFLFECDSAVPQADVDIFTSFLEETVEEGICYNDGDLITFGSMLLRVAGGHDSLTIEEPNFQSLPIEWRQGVTRSMQLLRLQKNIAESVGVEDEIDPPSIESSLLIGTDLTQQDEDLVLDRVESADSDSGWFVGRRDTHLNYGDEASLKRISVYQAILNWPKIGGFLALPAGCRVEVFGRKPRFTFNGRNLEIKSGSLIDAVAKNSQVNERQ